MHRFAHAAVLAIAISGPVLAGAIVDNSVVSVLGKPSGTGPCNSTCLVGGVGNGGANSDWKANGGQGAYQVADTQGHVSTVTTTGTVATAGQQAGREVGTGTVPGYTGTRTGNRANPRSVGHCTGGFC